MDIYSLTTVDKASEGEWLDLVSPVTGEPVGLSLKLAGVDSPMYRNASHEVQNQRLRHARAAGGGLTAEQIESSAMQILVKCTLAWKADDGEVAIEGEPLEFSPQNVLRLYEILPWAKDQADRFMADRGNYFGA